MIAILLSLMLSFTAEAKGFAGACPSLKDVNDEVFNCGDNDAVAGHAEACSKAVLASWRSVAASLQKALLANGNNARQDGSFADAKKDYRQAIEVLDAQVAELQKYTDLISHYPEVMIDFPGSRSADTSAGCFNENFDKIQRIVSEMDDEIIAAKEVREEMRALSGKSESARAKLADTLGGLSVASSSGAAAPAGRDWHPSDVSGTSDDGALASHPTVESGLTRARGEGEGAGTGMQALTDDSGNPFASEATEGRLTAEAKARAGAGQENPQTGLRSSAGSAVSFMLKGSAAREAFQSKDALTPEAYAASAGRANGGRNLASVQFSEASVSPATGPSLFEIVSRRYRQTELFR